MGKVRLCGILFICHNLVSCTNEVAYSNSYLGNYEIKSPYHVPDAKKESQGHILPQVTKRRDINLPETKDKFVNDLQQILAKLAVRGMIP